MTQNLKLAYRASEYFNSTDVYLFESNLKMFVSKVENSNGQWYTVKSLKYKASSVRCTNTKNLK